jgi:hypothetical protein
VSTRETRQTLRRQSARKACCLRHAEVIVGVTRRPGWLVRLVYPSTISRPSSLSSRSSGISATRQGRRLALRRPDRCIRCNTELPAGGSAWWDPVSRTVTCLDCLTAAVSAASPEPVDPGHAGASALREYQRRHDARDQHARDKLGKVGGLLAKVIEEPATIRAWQQGANGEVRVGARLEKLLAGTGVLLLHDRRVPGHGRANIDHIAVGQSGVTVIDTKTHRGKIRRDWYGGLFVERRTILRIDGRDQTKLVTGVEKQIGHVRAALDELARATPIDIASALCFPNVEGLPLLRRIEIRGTLVDGPKRVAELAARAGSLEAAAVEEIWSHLARAFPTA